MSTTGLHPLAADYLHRLERAARRLPRRDRRELVAEVGNHLSETTYAGMSDAEALTVLDRLGDPAEIVEAEQPDAVADDRRGLHEWAAIILLLLGGFIFGIGWIVGLILLWSSRAWTTADKLIGTFVIPGGLAGSFILLVLPTVSTSQVCGRNTAGLEHCTGGLSTAGTVVTIAIAAVLLIGPFFTAVYLARRAG
jgi:uncharacterized membrane protein